MDDKKVYYEVDYDSVVTRGVGILVNGLLGGYSKATCAFSSYGFLSFSICILF